MHALSVNNACMKTAPDGLSVQLCPNPAFIPEVMGPCIPIELKAFNRPPFTSAEQEQLHTLGPVHALLIYVDRTASFRRSDKMFVSLAKPYKGKPVSKQRLSQWIVGAISLVYTRGGSQPPAGLRAHSTRGLASSWALFKGVSIQDICAATSWSSPLTCSFLQPGRYSTLLSSRSAERRGIW